MWEPLKKWRPVWVGQSAWVVTLMIVIDVALRAILNQPLPAAWEASEVLMPFIVFLPFAYTLKIGAHVRVTLITDRLPKRVDHYLGIFTDLLSLLVCTLMTYYSGIRAWESLVINEEILAAVTNPVVARKNGDAGRDGAVYHTICNKIVPKNNYQRNCGSKGQLKWKW